MSDDPIRNYTSCAEQHCPLNVGEFQTKVLASLATLNTHMTILVGNDGNNGRFTHMEKTVAAHEAWINREKGAGGIVKNLWGAVLVILGGMITWLLKGK